MKSKKASEKLAKSVSSVLRTTLHIGANSTSCLVINQPKAPQSLERFKKIK